MMPEINCDMGEGYAIYNVCDDAEMMKHIQIANVACGFHAGDPVVINRTIRLARENGVRVGAHPSFPDRQGWGRREMKIERDELRDILIYQVAALKGFLDLHGMALNHIKPHGALYGAAAREENVTHAIADVAEIYGVPVYGMANTLHQVIYTARGVGFVAELYADLPYREDGSLIIMRQPPEVSSGQVVQRCLRAIAEGVVQSADGSDVKMDFDVICIHSDTPGAIAAAKALRAALDRTETATA